VHVRDLMIGEVPTVMFQPGTPAGDMLRSIRGRTTFDLVPVVGPDGALSGVVTHNALRLLSEESADAGWTIASDVMQPAVTLRLDDDLRTAAERMVRSHLRSLPVVDSELRVVGVLDESEIAKVYLRAAARADEHTQEIRLPPEQDPPLPPLKR
jgi:CBS domain-containing protein